MLVLTRRTGESIVIGNDIVVTVLEVRHDQVRIGIDAPRNVQVHREEVFAQVLQENTAAVASAADLANPLLRRPPASMPTGSAPPRKGPRLQPPAPPRSAAPRTDRPQAKPVAPPPSADAAPAPPEPADDAPGADPAG